MNNALPLTPDAARSMMLAGLEADIRRLSRLNARKRSLELLFFPALWLIGATITLYASHFESRFARLSVWILGLIISSLGLNAFVLLVHEAMHGLLFARRATNRWLAVLLGACVLVSYSAYKVMHLRHHRFLGDPRDPDDYDNYSRSPRVVWALHFMRLTVGSYLYILLMPFLGFRHGSRAHRRAILTEYAILLIFWSALLWLVPFTLLAQAWLLPLVLVAAMTGIRGFTQHGIADAHDPFLASRSIHPGRVTSFLLMHENLHLEHHLFPEIPSYHLMQVHALIAPRLPRAVTGRSYLAFIGKFLALTFTRAPRPIVGLSERSPPDRAKAT